jgi:hypothetical protein
MIEWLLAVFYYFRNRISGDFFNTIGQNRPLRMLAKFSMPKFSEWQLFGKQPFVRFGSTRPICDIQTAKISEYKRQVCGEKQTVYLLYRQV